jgi:hypothetical protein
MKTIHWVLVEWLEVTLRTPLDEASVPEKTELGIAFGGNPDQIWLIFDSRIPS